MSISSIKSQRHRPLTCKYFSYSTTPTQRLARLYPPPASSTGKIHWICFKLIFLIFSKDSRASLKQGTLTSCLIFTSYVSSTITSGTSVVSSSSTSTTTISISSARAVSTLETLVTLIVSATVYPVCTSDEISQLSEHQSSITSLVSTLSSMITALLR